ncbi:hypothetical protein BDP27DRAFT_1426571 [Rhodocollybia butyracea]|uniref:Uncharacterized protein n=1 Tax=Rhodocollybia butyracea TaxID=206335 RepID=A0A9P5U3I4_9AGAR|nr:hypothetical protein BDP27DRAFT_1426571 [Rhodocollybia butyracea]
MGQTPAIIVDSSAFNTSGLWTSSSSDPSSYRNISISLSPLPSLAGNISIDIDAQDVPMLSLIGQLDNTNCISDSLTIFGSGSPFPVEISNEVPPIFILDNIIWSTVIPITLPVLLDMSIAECFPSDPLLLYYALITPSPTMALDNQLLFVNYTDTTIVFDGGQWQGSVPNGGPGMLSKTSGDIMRFPFTGWNITLLGCFDPAAAGNITLGVSIDEQAQVQLEFMGDTPGQSPHVYFEYFTLVPESESGNHTITVEVIDVSLSQVFGFRGFTYVPGFATLNDMPALSTSISSLPSTSGSSPHKGLHGGAIAGVVIGAIAGLCLVGLILRVAIQRAKIRSSLSPAQAWIKSTQDLRAQGPDTITPYEKRYNLDTPQTNAHGITPYTKRYTPIVVVSTGDTTPDREYPVQQDSTFLLTPVESSVYMSLLPDQMTAEPPSSANNGDRTMRRESDRTDLILEKLNKLMHVIQQPPAYGQGVSQ